MVINGCGQTFPKDPLPRTFKNAKSVSFIVVPVLLEISLGVGRGGTGILGGCSSSCIWSPFSCECSLLLIIEERPY